MFKIRLKSLLAISLCFVACIQYVTAIDHVKCSNITAGAKIEGHLSYTHQTDCFIVQKHDETSDRLRVITRGQISQEEYYICTYVTQDNHGLGGGCAAQYRKENYNICPKTFSPGKLLILLYWYYTLIFNYDFIFVPLIVRKIMINFLISRKLRRNYDFVRNEASWMWIYARWILYYDRHLG